MWRTIAGMIACSRARAAVPRRAKVCASIIAVAILGVLPAARAATIDWKGHTWELTSGGMAGVCEGDPANVTVDSNGYLHLAIKNDGGTWSAAELFSTERLGFGTYQWQVDGPIDSYDKNVVLGLFPYGPAAGIGTDGTNEIDIEYARWGQANGTNGDFTNYPASGTMIGEHSFTFSLAGSLSTSRFVWSSTSIADFLFDGLEPIGGSTTPLETWTYMPPQPSTNIPQQALPLGINLWCFDAPPSDSKPVEIVIRDFQFVEEGAPGGSGGAGPGGAGSGGTGTGEAGGPSDGGTGANGGNATSGGTANTAGVSGAVGMAGRGGQGGSGGNAGAAHAASGGAPVGGAGASGTSAGVGAGGTAGASNTAGGAQGGSSGAGGHAGSVAPSQSSGCGCVVGRDEGSSVSQWGTILILGTLARWRRRRERSVPLWPTRTRGRANGALLPALGAHGRLAASDLPAKHRT